MLNNYCRVQQELGLLEMEATTITISECPIHDPDALIQRLASWRAMEGWICFQSGIQTLPAASLQDDLGYPLSGEVVDGEASEKLMPDGAGGWRLSRTVEHPLDGDMPVLTDNVVQIGNDHAPGDLRFRRYWRHDEQLGYQPYSARFIGFGEAS